MVGKEGTISMSVIVWCDVWLSKKVQALLDNRQKDDYVLVY